MITERQEQLLNTIVEEYINSAQPVSSQWLEKKYDFGICPATIRNEMQELTSGGFLCQPHTSAGRVPTDKGYRFFVNRWFEKEHFELDEDFEMPKEEIPDIFKFIQSLTKNLALASSAISLSYLKKKKILWKEGWEEIFKEPEFREKDYLINFVEFLKNFEENLREIKINSKIKIYIGRENPFSKAEDFSIILSGCRFPNEEKGVISILGPKRMSYNRNIGLINSLRKLLEASSGS
jgi:heat-inducible transcriptional repressor